VNSRNPRCPPKGLGLIEKSWLSQIFIFPFIDDNPTSSFGFFTSFNPYQDLPLHPPTDKQLSSSTFGSVVGRVETDQLIGAWANVLRGKK
jgi:hypothetical protein